MSPEKIEALKARIEARKAAGLTAAEFNVVEKGSSKMSPLDMQREIASVVREGLIARGSSLTCSIGRDGLAKIR